MRRLTAELPALNRSLARAEETIAELTEIGDSAQLAIDQLRAEVAAREAEAREVTAQRDALAAELFRVTRRNEGRTAPKHPTQEAAPPRDLPITSPDPNVTVGAAFRQLLRALRRRG